MAKETLVNTKELVKYDGVSDEGTGRQTMDGLVSWFVSICSSLSSLIVVGTIYSYGIFFPLILEEFQEAKATTGNNPLLSCSLKCYSVFTGAKGSVACNREYRNVSVF